MLKKILKIVFIVFFLLIAVAFSIPFLFKGKIVELAKSEINKTINAKVDFSDIDLSLFKHFPKLAASINSLEVIGINEFEKDTLFAAKNIDISLDLMSLVMGTNFNIYSINVNGASVHAIINKAGKANWDIMKPDSSGKNPSSNDQSFKLKLDAYSINNGYIKFDDRSSNMTSEVFNLNHSGKGDFTASLFTLVTSTSADAVSFSYGNIPYLSRTKTSIDADIQVDNKDNKYSFKTDKIALNELKLNAEGFFQFVNDRVYNMDIRFNAPSTDFKNILSLIPIIYQRDFASIKTSGEAIFNGFVKGRYSNSEIPAYNLNLDVKNSFFQYPDLPRPVKNINLSVKIDNPDGITDHSLVNIPQGHIEIDNAPFDFRLLLKTPVSDLFVDAAAKGKLDLSKIAQLVKLEPGTILKGLLDADLSTSGNMSAINKKQYDKFNASGTLQLKDLLYASKSYPDGIKLQTLNAKFNPRNITVSDVSGEYLKTNFTSNATIDNLLPYMLQDKTLIGALNIKADQVNLNDWMGTATDSSSKTSPTAPFVVPANLDFTIDASVDKVHYDKIDLQNLSGKLVIKDETVNLYNIKSSALEGSININGSYSTKESKTKPSISLAYDVKALDVQKTFNAFNTVQKLMPIGKFIAGKISSQLTFTGKLGDNMTPDLNTLSGNGNLFLIEGFLAKFAPLEQLATTLNIKELDAISVKDIKNYFEFANGKVLVKPFNVKIKDIDMEIAGIHGFDQSLDYISDMKIPRSLLGNNNNAVVSDLLNRLNSKVAIGKLGDFVNLKVGIGGTITKPVIKLGLKEAAESLADDIKKQVSDFAKAQIDSGKTTVTKAVKDTITSLKNQAIQTAGDELKKQLVGKKDSTDVGPDSKTKLVESAKGLLDNINPLKKKKTVTDTVK